MKNKKTCNCLGYQVYTGTLLSLPDSKMVINTINQYSYCMAEEDNDFKSALTQSDILLPDGIGIVAAAKFIAGDEIRKITGADLHQHMLEDLNRKGGSCFYLGSSEDTLQKIRTRITREFPMIKAYFFSPPFKAEFSEEDSEQMIRQVNEINPDALFLGMTAPKQEKWSYKFKDRLNTKYICSIGAVFDYYAETVKRPSQLWIDMGLEWLGRMIQEPRRLYKRYLIYGPVFAYILLKEKLQAMKLQPSSAPLLD